MVVRVRIVFVTTTISIPPHILKVARIRSLDRFASLDTIFTTADGGVTVYVSRRALTTLKRYDARSSVMVRGETVHGVVVVSLKPRRVGFV